MFYYLCPIMKHKKTYKITLEDFMLANRKASREEEIEAHGKQISMRRVIHKSLKAYDRKKQGKKAIGEY